MFVNPHIFLALFNNTEPLYCLTTANYISWCPWLHPLPLSLFLNNGAKYGLTVVQVCFQLSQEWSGYHRYQTYLLIVEADWCKFCIHFISLNARHCTMVEATGLKLWHRGHLQCHDLSAEFHEDLPVGSKVIRGHRRIDWFSHKPHFNF
jgi:hypothetical protein